MKNIDEFSMEKRLRELDPSLHRRFTDTVAVIQRMLQKYQRLFPEYTDHSTLHSLSVIHFCNRLIGPEQIKRLDADSIYILLMGCYLHDTGMGITEKQYEEFKPQIDVGDYFVKNPDISEFYNSFLYL